MRNSEKMPQNCCVPECKKKVYVEDGEKISYFKFPDQVKERDMFMKWIAAIRRDVGEHFKVTEHTKVCSRHFKPGDIVKAIAGRKRTLLATAVPSRFPWKKGSPVKRKAPKRRSPIKRKSAAKTTTTNAEDVSTCDVSITAQKKGSPVKRKAPTRRSPIKRKSAAKTTTTNAEDVSTCDVSITAQKSECQVLTSTSTYSEPCIDDQELQDISRDLKVENERLVQELCKVKVRQENLESEVEELTRRNSVLQARVFHVDRFDSDKDVAFYTGFPNRSVFESVFAFLDPGRNGENIIYWHSQSDESDTVNNRYDEDAPKQGRPRHLTLKDEYFLTLCRLRQGFKEDHLAHLYGISQTTVSRVIISWINFMYLKFSTIPVWPSRVQIDKHMPADFKERYPSTRVIIDCTEIRCQMPKSMRLNSELFSSYKNHTTLKSLVGISPGGALTFVSQLYTGHLSDREIVTRSGFLKLPFNRGDAVMADKGFTVEDLLPLGVSLNIPPFLGSKGQMSPEEVVETQSIAALRIHVERAINKIKNFHIWDSVVPFTNFTVVNQMWAVCAMLCNFQNSIISE